MKLILFGFKSTGKTHFGKLLANELNWTFIDTDSRIEKNYEMQFSENLTCRQIALKWGEEFFREIEKEVIYSIHEKGNAIISLGGGAILNANTCNWLKNLGRLVYLQIDKDILKKRMLANEIPSFLDPLFPEESFEKMYFERKIIYEKIESIKIAISGKLDSQVIEELKRILHG